MAKYLDGIGLSHFMSKIKDWASSNFASLVHTHSFSNLFKITIEELTSSGSVAANASSSLQSKTLTPPSGMDKLLIAIPSQLRNNWFWLWHWTVSGNTISWRLHNGGSSAASVTPYAYCIWIKDGESSVDATTKTTISGNGAFDSVTNGVTIVNTWVAQWGRVMTLQVSFQYNSALNAGASIQLGTLKSMYRPAFSSGGGSAVFTGSINNNGTIYVSNATTAALAKNTTRSVGFTFVML